MKACQECGCERMLPSYRRIPVVMPDGRTTLQLDAVQCDDCGRMFPREDAIEAAYRTLTTPTTPAPANL